MFESFNRTDEGDEEFFTLLKHAHESYKERDLTPAPDVIPITDQAIDAIPYIKFQTLSQEQSAEIHTLEKRLLVTSREHNKCQEVAIIYRLDEENFARYEDRIRFVFGTRNKVDIEKDTIAKNLIRNTDEAVVISMHNHPNDTQFSFDDMKFFLTHSSIRLFIIVSNKGSVESLLRLPGCDNEIILNSFYCLLKQEASRGENISFEENLYAIKKLLNGEDKRFLQKVTTATHIWAGKLDRYGLLYSINDGMVREDDKKEQIVNRSRRVKKAVQNFKIRGRGFTR